MHLIILVLPAVFLVPRDGATYRHEILLLAGHRFPFLDGLVRRHGEDGFQLLGRRIPIDVDEFHVLLAVRAATAHPYHRVAGGAGAVADKHFACRLKFEVALTAEVILDGGSELPEDIDV